MWQLSVAASWLVVLCAMGVAAVLARALGTVIGRAHASAEAEAAHRALAALPHECFDVGRDWLAL